MKAVRIRLTPDLDAELERLRTEHQTNISAWVRTAIAQRLERDRAARKVAAARRSPAARAPARESSPRPPSWTRDWSPRQVTPGEWGAGHKNPEIMPADLVGRTIQIQRQDGATWSATVLEVVRTPDPGVLVRTTAMPADLRPATASHKGGER